MGWRVRRVVAAFGRDQRVDPFEISLGGLGAVLEERPGVAVAAAGRRAAGARQAVGERSCAAGSSSSRRASAVEVAAERELQREGALVVAGGVVVEQQLARAGRRRAR